MYILNTTNQFKKDYKLCKKRGYSLKIINSIFLLLEKDGLIPAKYKPYKLTGNYNGFWECHLQPDWLLIWLQNDSLRTITFIRTGTHSDLF